MLSWLPFVFVFGSFFELFFVHFLSRILIASGGGRCTLILSKLIHNYNWEQTLKWFIYLKKIQAYLFIILQWSSDTPIYNLCVASPPVKWCANTSLPLATIWSDSLWMPASLHHGGNNLPPKKWKKIPKTISHNKFFLNYVSWNHV